MGILNRRGFRNNGNERPRQIEIVMDWGLATGRQLLAFAYVYLAGPARPSQASLDLAEQKRSALSLNSVGGRGVSCLWIRLPVFITSSCAGTEGRHTIPDAALSVSRLSPLPGSRSLLQHWREPWKITGGWPPLGPPINGACP